MRPAGPKLGLGIRAIYPPQNSANPQIHPYNYIYEATEASQSAATHVCNESLQRAHTLRNVREAYHVYHTNPLGWLKNYAVSTHRSAQQVLNVKSRSLLDNL
jgi:hypothetical protein